MSNEKIKVDELYFETATDQLMLKLADGTERVMYLMPTGNCWVECWVTPERRDEIVAEHERREKEWKDEAAARRLEEESKKRWWNR